MSQQVKEYFRRQVLRWRHSLVHLFTLSVASFLDQYDAVANERRLDHSGVELPVADLHGNGVARHNARGNAGKRNRFPERGRERAAGDLTVALRRHDLLMAAQDAAFVNEHEPD